MRIRLFILGLAASFTLTACGQSGSGPSAPAKSITERLQLLLRGSLQNRQIAITDRFGTPLANASVLIGQAVGNPFANNFLLTDSQGVLNIPAAWTTPQSVTVETTGFVRTTFINVYPHTQILELNEAQGRANLEVTGQTTGWTDVKKDGFVDFSIVLPMANHASLFSFNVSDLLSPEVDKIQAYGQDIFIPSNFSLPKQSENYGLFPVSLEKLIYRSYVRRPDQYRYVAGRGKFSFKTVLGKLENGQSFWDVLNDMDFISAGTASVLVSQASTPLNLPVGGFAIAPSIKVTAINVPAGASYLASVWNEDQGVSFPSDVKTFNNNETRTLEASAGLAQYVVSIVGKHKVLKNSMITLEERSSRAVTPVQTTSLSPQHLDLIDAPGFNGQSITARPPSYMNGYQPSGTVVMISDVDIKDTNTTYHETKTHIWEVYAQGWNSTIDLPEWPSPIGQSSSKRLEVMYLATPLVKSQTGTTQVGPAMIDSSTHATKNAVDF